MTEPMIIEKAKSFYDEMKITDKCTFSDISNKILPVRTYDRLKLKLKKKNL
jgi:hypothetical protein